MVPMSASNLSRIELGAQGPPADEIIERIGVALDANPADLLRAAGRYATGMTFEETDRRCAIDADRPFVRSPTARST
jgi:hypothetical protein